MGRVSIIVFAGLVAIQGYSLEAAATPAAKCPFLAPGAASGDPGGSFSANPVADPGDTTRNESTTPTLATPTLVLSPDGRLSVDIAGLSLECVLRELGRQGEITVRVKRPAADGAVWHRFSGLSLSEGVRLLLDGRSYRLLHGGPANGGDASQVARVLDILVLRSGQRGLDAEPAPINVAPPSHAEAPAPPAPEETDPATRSATLLALADRNQAELEKAMARAIEDSGIEEDDFHKRILAAGDRMADPAPAEVLAAVVRSATTAEDRMQALALLSETSEELSVRAINRALDDPDPYVSGLAQETFAELRTGALVEAVAATALDEDWQVRAAALRTLEDMHEFAPVGELAATAMEDPDSRVRVIALELLAYGNPDAAMDSFSDALYDASPKVRELAANLLDEFEQRQQQDIWN